MTALFVATSCAAVAVVAVLDPVFHCLDPEVLPPWHPSMEENRLPPSTCCLQVVQAIGDVVEVEQACEYRSPVCRCQL